MRYARLAALAATATLIAVLVVPSGFAADAQPPDPDAVPGAVTILQVGPGGGSGEVQLTWEAVPNATGYRVLRSDTAEGQFDVAAEFDVTTGSATAADGVVNVFSEQHSYIPPLGSFEGPDQSSQFSYVDVGPRQRCFVVVAFSPAADGPASAVACGAPPGAELEPEPEPAIPVPAEPTFTG